MEYHVPSTGACVTLSNAKSLLFYFCNKLPSDRYASGAMRPRFSTTILQGPDGLPVEPEPLSGQQQPLVSAPSQPIPPTAAHASQLAAAAGQPTNGHAAGQPADCAADAILQQQQQQQSGGAEPQSILSSPVTGVPAAPDAMEAADASVSLSGKAEPSRQPSSATVIMSPAAVNQSAQVKKHPSGAIVLSTAASEDELREREGNPRRHRKSRRLARHEAAAAAAAAADGEAEEDEDEGSKQSNCWFQAQVLLPNNCPVPRAQGPPQPKRSLAVAAACVEAIRQLHQAGAMSDYLIPDSETLPEPDKDTADDYTPVDQLPELSANPGASDLPRLASIAPKVPDILKQPPAAVESGLSQGFLRVHIYRFSLHVPRPHPDDHKELSQPLGLVVPRKLPSLPGGMPVTLASGSKALASLVYLGFHSVSPDRMAQIRRFHNAMCDVAASKPKASSTSAQAQTITATPLVKRRRTGPNPIAAPPPPATAKLAELPAVPVEMEDGELPIQPTSAAATQPEVVQACRRRLAAEVQQGAVQQSSEAKTTDAAAQTAQGLAPTSVPADKSMAEAFQSAAAAAEQSDLQLKAAAPGSQHDQISDNRLQPAPDATVMPALDAAEQLVSNPGPHANGHISPPFSSAGVQPATAAQPVASKQVIEWHPDTQPASPVSAGNQRMARKQHASAAIQHFIGFLSSPVKPKTNGPTLSLLKMQLAGIKPTKLPKTQAMPAHAGAKLPTRRNSSAIRSPGGPTLVEDVPTASMPAALHVTASALSPLGIGQLRMPTQQMTSAAPTTSSQLSAACNGQATATNMKLQLSAVPDNAHKTVAASPDTATASKRGQLPIKRNAAEDPAGVKQLSSSVLVCPQIQSGASMTEPPAKRVCTDSAQQPAQDVQMQDSLPAAKHSAPGTPAQPDLEPAVVQPIVLKPADSVTVTTATAKSAPIDSAPGFQAAAAKPHANPASDPAMPSGSAAPAASVRDDSAEPAWGLAVVPLLPASSHSTQHFTPKALADQIDWKGLDKMSRERMTIPWDSMGRWALEDFLEDAMLVTTYNGMLYAFRGMEYGMNPSMVMPCSSNGPVQSEHTSKDASADVVGSKHRQPELGGQMTFITYYRYRWKVGGVKPEQPLIKVVSKDGRFTSDTEEEKLIYLVPQLCHVHPLRSAAVGAAKRLLPRLLWQLHVLLLAEELRGFMASFMYEVLPAGASFRQPELKKVVEAVTPQASQEEYSYEVLENLGDAFVKYSTCLSLFTSFPSAHEGQLTARKDRLVSNENLARVGLRLGLEHYIALPWQSYSFRNGCVAAPPRQMRIKVVADCVEALTGVFFLAGGEQAGFAFVAGALELLPMLTPLAPAAVRSDISSKSVRALEEVVGYRWRNAGLAREACTHCSWPDSACPSYQRLEFLGDALIDLGVTHHFATTHRNITPGSMHDLRSASVNNTRMSCAAAARRLHTFLRYMSAQLFGDIERFMTGLHNSVQAKKEAMLKANHAQLRCMPVVDGQRRKDRLTLDAKRRVYDETVQEAGFGHSGIAGAPKVLGDIVEALAAAVYLDSGRDLDLTWRIFGDMLSPLPTPDTVPMHPVRDILERCNKAGFIFKFETVLASDEGCTAQAAVVDDVVLGKCTSAPNMKAARLLCAKDAIQNWIKAPAPKPGSVTAAILEGQSSRPHN